MTGPRVVVLDYGSGNLRSAERALERAGADVTVTPDLDLASRADGLVVPGVGAFAAVMAGIDGIGAGPVITDRVRAGSPVLGICVGMQVMFDGGDEHGVVTKGLGLVPGTVSLLNAPVVPHMGWNTVEWPAESRFGAGVAGDTRFYFVHSYAARPIPGVPGAAVTTHGEPFVAAFESGSLWATQFHPEKSGDAGARILKNWVDSLG
ncbi:imidazole glycerol phosphate synthase subunit HisH [Virgisporangium aliadipatigenens]|uniref:Imidazole glycerol phosphate synthase subunit HisH n=1 Tax=Virgisporangium aliadipatigenens TaxID=741659 RepID=A0A8J3YY78_9ACTN|nr:imidazole glycerol phosphate synthase subunit HisH [Virgisporangium aliadipatigenens]GIJ51890.1 imidazole glycerol phosphate synthase subunit HisH [Virgisporangium aliadipatigenens]